ncbi:MAG: M48 family metalloprotease [Proteobacteria bacterium]|nr:M48 family metalloprotease [Pseudomonadota bacterium]
MTNLSLHKLIAPLLIGILLASGCAVNPVTGKNELAFISESQEIAIGAEQYAPSQQSQGGRYRVDPSLTDYVSEVGMRVARESDRALPYEFVVLNDSSPNAWALPGGKIAVNRGLLMQLESEAELAAVLGHEIVHSAARHGAQSMQRGVLLQGAMIATSLATQDEAYGNYVVGAAQLGAQLVTLKYGRGAELEADRYGIEYMVQAGYDPRAAISLQETFVRLSDSGAPNWLEGLFSSHPPSMDRVQANRESVSQLDLRADLETGKERYDQALAHLRSVQPAYEELQRAQFLVSENKLESAETALHKAIRIEPNEALFHGTLGDVYRLENRFESATGAYDQALALDAEYYRYYLGRGLALARQGRNVEARADLTRSNQLLPTATAMTALGNLSLAAGQPGEAKEYFRVAMSADNQQGKIARSAYIRLDLPDNPGAYFDVSPALDDGVLVANIENKSGLAVRLLDVHFAARINGEPLSRIVTVRDITGWGRVSSGWRLRDDDILSDVRVTIANPRL